MDLNMKAGKSILSKGAQYLGAKLGNKVGNKVANKLFLWKNQVNYIDSREN